MLRQVVYSQKCVASLQKYQPAGLPNEREYLCVTTFTERQPQPLNVFEQGFTSELKAPDWVYQLEVLPLPKSPSEFDLLRQEAQVEKFNENQVLNCVNQVTLDVDKVYKNYIAVASIKIDTSLAPKRGGIYEDRGYYSSALHLFQIHQGKLRICLVEN
jgi:hypothetical protein